MAAQSSRQTARRGSPSSSASSSRVGSVLAIPPSSLHRPSASRLASSAPSCQDAAGPPAGRAPFPGALPSRRGRPARDPRRAPFRRAASGGARDAENLPPAPRRKLGPAVSASSLAPAALRAARARRRGARTGRGPRRARRCNHGKQGRSSPRASGRSASTCTGTAAATPVEPLLRYCELQGYRPPNEDDYGWARLAQVVGNFFERRPVGRRRRLHHRRPHGPRRQRRPTSSTDGASSSGCEPSGREGGSPHVVRFAEEREGQRGHGFDEMLRAFDEAMPERLRLGEFLDAGRGPPPASFGSATRCGCAASTAPGGRTPSSGSASRSATGSPSGVETPGGTARIAYPDLPYVRPLRPRRGLLLELQQLRPRRHGEDQATSRGRLAPRGARRRGPAGAPSRGRRIPLAPPRPGRTPRAASTPPSSPGPDAPSRAAKTFRAAGALPRRAEAQGPPGFASPLAGPPEPRRGSATRRGQKGPAGTIKEVNDGESEAARGPGGGAFPPPSRVRRPGRGLEVPPPATSTSWRGTATTWSSSR